MIETIKSQQMKIEEIGAQMQEMQHDIDVKNMQLKSPEHRVALAIKDMMHAEAANVVNSHTPSIVRSQVTKHLHVDIDTCSYYEGGARRYDSDANIEWH